MTHPLDEAQDGVLIDKYFILNWIIMPTILIGLIIGIIYLLNLTVRCQYINVVDSCFPYNLPNWIKYSAGIITPICIIVLIIIFIRSIRASK